MQDAGRILLMPKGDYSADATYEMLDLVNHNDASWVCKKDCTGQEPSDSNTEFWQRFGTAVDMSNLNAKTLDGHEAEYFVDRGQSLRSSILEKALEVGIGVYHFMFNGANYTADDLPSSTYRYGSATVIKRAEGAITVIAWGSTNASYTHFLPRFNYYNNGTWTGWKGIDDFLPLTGGEVANASADPLRVKNTDSTDGAYIKLSNADGTLGYYGFNISGEAIVMLNEWRNSKKLLHTGNRPYGNYVGNGDATARTINVGGTGAVCFVSSPKGGAIVFYHGALTAEGWKTNATFRNGVLNFSTNSEIFNADGITHYYWT